MLGSAVVEALVRGIDHKSCHHVNLNSVHLKNTNPHPCWYYKYPREWLNGLGPLWVLRPYKSNACNLGKSKNQKGACYDENKNDVYDFST